MSHSLVMYRTKPGLVLLLLLSITFENSQGKAVIYTYEGKAVIDTDDVPPASLLTKSLRSHNPIPYIPLNSLTFNAAANNGILNWMYEGPSVLRQMIKNSKLAGVKPNKTLSNISLHKSTLEKAEAPIAIDARPDKPLLTGVIPEKIYQDVKPDNQLSTNTWPYKQLSAILSVDLLDKSKPNKLYLPDVTLDKILKTELKSDKNLLGDAESNSPILANVKSGNQQLADVGHNNPPQDDIDSNNPLLYSAKPVKPLLKDVKPISLLSEIRPGGPLKTNIRPVNLLSTDNKPGKPLPIYTSPYKTYPVNKNPYHLQDDANTDKTILDGITAKPWMADVWPNRPLFTGGRPYKPLLADVTPDNRPTQVIAKPNKTLAADKTDKPFVEDIRRDKPLVPSGIPYKPLLVDADFQKPIQGDIRPYKPLEDITPDKLLLADIKSNKPLFSDARPSLIFDTIQRNPLYSKEENLKVETQKNPDNQILNYNLQNKINISNESQSLNSENSSIYTESHDIKDNNKDSLIFLSSNSKDKIDMPETYSKKSPSFENFLENVFEHFDLSANTLQVQKNKNESSNRQPSDVHTTSNTWLNPEIGKPSKINLYNLKGQGNIHYTGKPLTDSNIIWIITTQSPKATQFIDSHDKYTSTGKPVFSTYYENTSHSVNTSTIKSDETIEIETSTVKEMTTTTTVRLPDKNESFEEASDNLHQNEFKNNSKISPEGSTALSTLHQISNVEAIKHSADVLTTMGYENIDPESANSIMGYEDVGSMSPSSTLSDVHNSINLTTKIPITLLNGFTDGNILEHSDSSSSVFHKPNLDSSTNISEDAENSEFNNSFNTRNNSSDIVSNSSISNISIRNNFTTLNNSEPFAITHDSISKDVPYPSNIKSVVVSSTFINFNNNFIPDFNITKIENSSKHQNLTPDETLWPGYDTLQLLQLNTSDKTQQLNNVKPLSVQTNISNELQLSGNDTLSALQINTSDEIKQPEDDISTLLQLNTSDKTQEFSDVKPPVVQTNTFDEIQHSDNDTLSSLQIKTFDEIQQLEDDTPSLLQLNTSDKTQELSNVKQLFMLTNTSDEIQHSGNDTLSPMQINTFDETQQPVNDTSLMVPLNTPDEIQKPEDNTPSLVQLNTLDKTQQPGDDASPLVQLNVWNYLTGNLKLTETQAYPPSIINVISHHSKGPTEDQADNYSSSNHQAISDNRFNEHKKPEIETDKQSMDDGSELSNITHEDSLNIPTNLYEFVLSQTRNESNGEKIKKIPNGSHSNKPVLGTDDRTPIKNETSFTKTFPEKVENNPISEIQKTNYINTALQTKDNVTTPIFFDVHRPSAIDADSTNNVQNLASLPPVIHINKEINNLKSNIVNNLHTNQHIINIHNPAYSFPQGEFSHSSLKVVKNPKPQETKDGNPVLEKSKIEDQSLSFNSSKTENENSIAEKSKTEELNLSSDSSESENGNISLGEFKIEELMLSSNSSKTESESAVVEESKPKKPDINSMVYSDKSSSVSPSGNIDSNINTNDQIQDVYSTLLNDTKTSLISDVQNLNKSIDNSSSEVESNDENYLLWDIDSASLVSEYIKRVSEISILFDDKDVTDPEISSMIENLALQSLLSYLVEENKLSPSSDPLVTIKDHSNSLRNITEDEILSTITPSSVSPIHNNGINSQATTPSTAYYISTIVKSSDISTSPTSSSVDLLSTRAENIKISTTTPSTNNYQWSTQKSTPFTNNQSLSTNKEYAINIFSKVIIDSIIKENGFKFPATIAHDQPVTPLTTKIETYISPSLIKIRGSSIPHNTKFQKDSSSPGIDIDKIIADKISNQKNTSLKPLIELADNKEDRPGNNGNRSIEDFIGTGNLHKLFDDQYDNSYDYKSEEYDLIGDIVSSVPSAINNTPSITSSFTDTIKNSVSKVTQMISDLVPSQTTFQSCLNNLGCAFALASSVAIGATGALAVPFVIPLGRRKRQMSEEESRIFYLNGNKRLQEEFERIIRYLATNNSKKGEGGVLIMKGNIIKFLEEEMKKIQNRRAKSNSTIKRKHI